MEKVCIIGSLNMELIIGPVGRMPDWGKQAFAESFEQRGAGSAVRVAFPLAKLGVKSSIIGAVGNDRNGQEIIGNIKNSGLTTKGVDIIKGSGTGVCISVKSRGGDRAYITDLGALVKFNENNLAGHRVLMQAAKYILLTGYFVLPGLRGKGLRSVFKRAREAGKTTLLDTGWDPGNWRKETLREVRSLLEHVDVFLPNEDEAKALTSAGTPEKMAEKLSSCGPGMVVIKLGERGSLARTRGGIVAQSAFPAEVVDKTAAGEAFNAGVLFGLVNGWKAGEILKFSNALASLVISGAGGGCPSLDEVRRAMGTSRGGFETRPYTCGTRGRP